MIQPLFLHAFASTPVRVAAAQRAVESNVCEGSGCERNRAAHDSQPVDELQLSEQALALAQQGEELRPQPAGNANETDRADQAAKGDSVAAEAGEADAEHEHRVRGNKPPQGEESGETASVVDLTEEEQQQVAELKNRDREVRTHEQAHLSAAGPYAQGGATFEYQNGPDGRQYAVGGEVSIDTSTVSGDPEATIQKAQQIRAAALAPASPSGQDQSVAAAATQMESQARAELSKQNQANMASGASYGAAEEPSTGTLLDLVA